MIDRANLVGLLLLVGVLLVPVSVVFFWPDLALVGLGVALVGVCLDLAADR